MEGKERAERLVEYIKHQWELLLQSELKAAREATEQARTNVKAWVQARDAITAIKTRLVKVKQEKEYLPARTYAANLSEDHEGEAKIRERFKRIPGEIAELERQLAVEEAIFDELLGPKKTMGKGTYADVSIYQEGKAVDRLGQAIGTLDGVYQTLKELMEPPLSNMSAEITRRGGMIQGWQSEQRWDPEVQAWHERRGAQTPVGGR